MSFALILLVAGVAAVCMSKPRTVSMIMTYCPLLLPRTTIVLLVVTSGATTNTAITQTMELTSVCDCSVEPSTSHAQGSSMYVAFLLQTSQEELHWDRCHHHHQSDNDLRCVEVGQLSFCTRLSFQLSSDSVPVFS